MKTLYKSLGITLASVVAVSVFASSDEVVLAQDEETVTIENNFTISPPRGTEGDSEEHNETVEIAKNPENVVIFDLGLATTFVELGIEDAIAGLPKGENNASLSEDLAVFEDEQFENLGGLFEPNYELIAQIQPELILLSGRQSSTDIIAELEAAAPNAEIVNIAANNVNYIEDIKASTLILGELFEVEEEAETLVEELDTRIEELNEMIDAGDNSMLFIQTNGGDLAFHGVGGRYGFLFEELNFEIAGELTDTETENHGNQVSFEFIAESNPELIFVMDRGAATSTGEATNIDVLVNDVTSSVAAVQNENIYELSPVPWYLNAGGYGTLMTQLDEIEAAVAE